MIQPNQPNDVSWKSRVRGALLGSAVGDALGVPVEFKSRASLATSPVRGMIGWGTHNQPPGTWSDDTSMTLCVLESINRKGWDIDDQAVRFLRWLGKGHLTAHDEVFDAGRSTVQSLERIADGYAALDAGCFEEDSNGNGSLMRNVPGSIYCAIGCSDTETAENIANSSAITHAHPRSRLGCVIHALLCSELLKFRRIDSAIIESRRRLDSILGSSTLFSDMKQELPHYRNLIDSDLELATDEGIESSGYVVHTIEAAVWALLSSHTFEECVLKAVNLGEDTDTVGAVAGGLAGLYWGVEDIPGEWIEGLVRAEMIEEMIEEFIELLEQVRVNTGARK